MSTGKTLLLISNEIFQTIFGGISETSPVQWFNLGLVVWWWVFLGFVFVCLFWGRERGKEIFAKSKLFYWKVSANSISICLTRAEVMISPPNHLLLINKVLNNTLHFNSYKWQSCWISSGLISSGFFLWSYLTLQTLLPSLMFSLISGRKGFEKSVTHCAGRLLTCFKISLKVCVFV